MPVMCGGFYSATVIRPGVNDYPSPLRRCLVRGLSVAVGTARTPRPTRFSVRMWIFNRSITKRERNSRTCLGRTPGLEGLASPHLGLQHCHCPAARQSAQTLAKSAISWSQFRTRCGVVKVVRTCSLPASPMASARAGSASRALTRAAHISTESTK